MGEIIFDELDFTVEGLSTTGSLKNTAGNAVEAFHGAVICERGAYKDRAIMMEEKEKFIIGTGEDGSIETDSARIHKMICVISYDDKQEEYLVEPRERCSVFLASGQPLGRDRLYCIPRGMRLVINNEEKVIRLG